METRAAPTRILQIAIAGLATVAALALIAAPGDAARARAAKVVVIKTIGKTRVFADGKGKTLYSPVQEKSGKVLCVGSCTGIWKPLKTTAPTGQLTAIHAGLGTVKRPDGSKQVAFHKHPLYSFSVEGPGELTGDGIKDVFGKLHFTWQAAELGTSSAPAPVTNPAPPVYPGY